MKTVELYLLPTDFANDDRPLVFQCTYYYTALKTPKIIMNIHYYRVWIN